MKLKQTNKTTLSFSAALSKIYRNVNNIGECKESHIVHGRIKPRSKV